MTGKDPQNKHTGHRERLRNRFLNESLTNFSPHQVLELLLFNVVPRADTNEMAHDLLHKFGSFSGVLEADIKDLTKVDGVGNIVATFIKTLAPLSRYYRHDRIHKQNPKLNSSKKVVDYLSTILDTKNSEAFYVLCLDSQCGVIYPALLSEGVVNETAVYPREVVQIALKHHAAAIIVAHNHPSGNSSPSSADVKLTERLVNLMQLVNIPLLDHIIIAADNHYSFKQSSGLFD